MRFLFVLFLAFYPSVSVNAQPQKIASARITFEFPSKKVKGSIEGFESESQINWDVPSQSVLKGSVQVATLDTNNGLRNWSLRSSRYFNAKTFPEITFLSQEIRKTGNHWTVIGDLTIKGITQPFKIEFTESNGKLLGNGNLYVSDFGIKIKKNREDNLVKVRFEFELIR